MSPKNCMLKNFSFRLIIFFMIGSLFVGNTGMLYSLPVDRETLSPPITITHPQLWLQKTPLLTFGQHQTLYEKLMQELVEVDTVLCSLENAIFQYNEQEGRLQAELTGVRTGGLGRYIGDLAARKKDRGEKVATLGLIYHYELIQKINFFGQQMRTRVALNIDDLEKQGVLFRVRDTKGKPVIIKIQMTKQEVVFADLILTYRDTQTGKVPMLALYVKDEDSELYIDSPRSEKRLRHEKLLGKGGVRALEWLHTRHGMNVKNFHINEGSAALIAVYAISSGVFQDVEFSGVMHTPEIPGLTAHDGQLYDKYFFDLGNEWKHIIFQHGIEGRDLDFVQVLMELCSNISGVSKEFVDVFSRMLRERYSKEKAEKYIAKLEAITNGIDLWAYQHPSLRQEAIEKEVTTDKSRGQVIMEKKQQIKRDFFQRIKLCNLLVRYAFGDIWQDVIRETKLDIYEEKMPAWRKQTNDLLSKLPRLPTPIFRVMKQEWKTAAFEEKVLATYLDGRIEKAIEQIAMLLNGKQKDSPAALKKAVRQVFKKNELILPSSFQVDEFEAVIDKIVSIPQKIEELVDNPVSMYGRRWTYYKMDYPLMRGSNIKKLIDAGNRFMVAGVAHPHDPTGAEWISEAIKLSHRYFGEYIFIPGYDLELDKMMTQAADVWLYSPILQREACGTSNLAVIVNYGISVAAMTGWSLEHLVPFDKNTGIGNGFAIEPYPMPAGDGNWQQHIQGLRAAGWEGLLNPYKEIGELWQHNRMLYYQLLENIYNTAPNVDMIIPAAAYARFMIEKSVLIGTHTGAGVRIEQTLTFSDRENFRVIQISFHGSGFSRPADLSDDFIEHTLKPALLNKFVTVHLGIVSIAEWENMEAIKEMIDFAARINARAVSFHMNGNGEEFVRRTVELIEYAAERNILFHFENAFVIAEDKIKWHTPEQMNELYALIEQEIKRRGKTELQDKYGFVFDAAHAKIAVGDPLAFYEKLNKQLPIAEVNIHGIEKLRTGGVERHLPLSDDQTMRQAVPELMRRLVKERGFRGPFIIEFVGTNLPGDGKMLRDAYESLFSPDEERYAVHTALPALERRAHYEYWRSEYFPLTSSI